jgi:uncharacterized membrane protein
MTGDNLALVVTVLLIATLLHWLPLWRRQGLWFGVTVAPGFDATADGRAALRRYRTAVWSLSAVAVACVVGGVLLAQPALPPVGVLGQTFGAYAAFAVVRRAIRPFAAPPSGVRSATLSPDDEALPGGAASVVVPLGMLVATAVYLRANWLRIPERVPVHWSIDGTPNGWADRTWQGVYGPLAVCALMCAFILLMAEAILHASPRARVAGAEAWTRRFRRANLVVLVSGVWGVSAMMCLFSLMPLVGGSDRATKLAWMIPAVVVLPILPLVWQLVRIAREPGSGSDGTPDRCWKLGFLYYNPADPALMVEKRFGVGYTINLGSRTVWWVLGIAGLLSLLVKVAR